MQDVLERSVSTQATIGELQLGVSSDMISLTTSEDNRDATLALAKQARRSINILSYDLEPRIYNNRLLVSALRSFVAADRHSRVNVLIRNFRNLVVNGHQLVEFSRQFSSYVTIKQLHEEDSRMTQGYMIADETGIVLRHEALRFEGIANFNDRFTCREFSNKFDIAWQRASQVSELKRLHL